jgi:hypothetical protein
MTTPTKQPMPVTWDPKSEWTLAQWKDWVHEHVDIHDGTVQLAKTTLLEIVAERDSFRDQVERVQKAWDEERQRL